MRATPSPTHYLEDFLRYYARAKVLEDRNHRGGKRKTCGDPLQDHVSIYDTVQRRFAGFSNVLRDLHGGSGRRDDADGQWGRENPERLANTKKWSLETWLYVYGIHRMTGSGASFFPKSEGPRRHGYCNVVVPELADCVNIRGMVQVIRDRAKAKIPMFSSFGNQPPPFPKPEDDYATGGVYFFCEVWPQFVEMVHEELQRLTGITTISMFTDWMLELNRCNQLKAFKFAYTAFVMDIADWHPQLMPPSSQCYYGANCLVAMNAMFSENNRTKGGKFYHECMEALIPECSKILGVEAQPMDVEDCACDAVRYWSRFVPRHGYAHLEPHQRESTSVVPVEEFLAFCETAPIVFETASPSTCSTLSAAATASRASQHARISSR